MGPRYPAGPRPGVRMPQIGNEFNGVSRNWQFFPQWVIEYKMKDWKLFLYELSVFHLLTSTLLSVFSSFTSILENHQQYNFNIYTILTYTIHLFKVTELILHPLDYFELHFTSILSFILCQKHFWCSPYIDKANLWKRIHWVQWGVQFGDISSHCMLKIGCNNFLMMV